MSKRALVHPMIAIPALAVSSLIISPDNTIGLPAPTRLLFVVAAIINISLAVYIVAVKWIDREPAP